MFGLKSTLIAGAVGAVACAALWLFWTADVAQLKLDHENALKAQEKRLNEQCEKDKAITKEVSDELQTKLSAADEQLARVKRVQPSRCVPVLADPAKRDDGTANGMRSELYNLHGVTSDALYNFSHRCEKIGAKLDTCQSFVTKERK